MTLFVSVNRQAAVSNAETGGNEPIYEIRRSKDDPNPRRYNNFSITGCSIRGVYEPNNPLISGAFAWIEVDTD